MSYFTEEQGPDLKTQSIQVLLAWLSCQFKAAPSTAKGLHGECTAWRGGPCAWQVLEAGTMPQGQNEAKTGVLQFTSHQLPAIPLVIIHC